MKYIKSKDKCDCDNHYLELRYYDDENLISKRVCYKCGKWWSHINHNPAKKISTHKFIKCIASYELAHHQHTAQHGDIYYLTDTRRMVVFLDNYFMYIS